MSYVNVTGIRVLGNPSKFKDNFQFEITFECVKELDADLEWKLTYVGSAEDESCDQELDSVLVGPVPVGVNRFVFETPPPDTSKIPKQDLLGVTVCLISCCYKGKEFIRIGYYINNEYDDPQLISKPEDEEEEPGTDIGESDNEEEDEEDENDEDDNEAENEDENDDDDGKAEDKKNAECVDASQDGSVEDDNGSQSLQSRENVVDNVSNESKKASKTNFKAGSSDSKCSIAESENGDVPAKKRLKTEDGVEYGDKKKQVFEFPPDFSVDKIRRLILEDKPRLTRFLIDWDA